MSSLTHHAIDDPPQAVSLVTGTKPANEFPARTIGRGGREARLPAAVPADATLMRRASAGDAGAFALLYDRHAPAALGLAHRMVWHQGAAEDVVQEAFLGLWRSSTYRPAKGSVRGFLLRIVHNAAVDHLRREQSRGAGRHVAEVLAHPIADDYEIDAEVERVETARGVRDALAALPESQQRSLELAYFGDLTHAEIAHALGVPVGTVKSRLRLGLQKLREQIDSPCWA